MRKKAYEINKEKVPPAEIPGPAVLLPIEDVYSITWRGSTGASSYIIERRTENSNWITIAENVTDAGVAYRPLFYDSSAVINGKYFYRIKAQNEVRISEASNEIGPVEVNFKKLVDEYDDTSKIFLNSNNLKVINKNYYRAKEDFHRLGTDSVSYIIYDLSENIDSVRVEAFLAG